MIPSAWLQGLFGFLVRGNGIGDGTEDVHANKVVLSDGVTGVYDEANRTVTVTTGAGAGSTGPTGPGYYAWSSTNLLIATGERTFTVQTGLAYIAGTRARAVSDASSANYMEGVVTGYSGTTLVISVDTIGGSGTHTDWLISLSGTQGPTGSTWFAEVDGATGMRVGDFGLHTFGPGGSWVYQYDGVSAEPYVGWNQVANISGQTGPNGPGYAATSASSLAIGTGSRTFVTQAGLAYSAGQRVRASMDETAPARYMEGLVTSYSGTSLVVLVDRVYGEGTLADWIIGVAGDAGATGPAGANRATLGPWGATVFDAGATGANWQYLSPTPTAAPIVATTGTDATVQLPARVYAPRAGTVTGMTVTIESSHSADLTFTLYINGSSTACTVTIAVGDTTGTVSGLSLSLSLFGIMLIRNDCDAVHSAMLAKAMLNVTWT